MFPAIRGIHYLAPRCPKEIIDANDALQQNSKPGCPACRPLISMKTRVLAEQLPIHSRCSNIHECGGGTTSLHVQRAEALNPDHVQRTWIVPVEVKNPPPEGAALAPPIGGKHHLAPRGRKEIIVANGALHQYLKPRCPACRPLLSLKTHVLAELPPFTPVVATFINVAALGRFMFNGQGH